MGKKRLILHIGSPKTGTSALQYVLFDNRDRLAEQGIIYPAGVNLSLAKAHHPLYFAVSKKWWDPSFYYEITEERISPTQYKQQYEIGDFLRELRFASEDADRIILSSEGFFELDDPGIGVLSNSLDDYDVEIVVYLRRQDKYVEALYRHFVFDAGARFTEGIEDYLDHVPNINYLEKLDCWQRHFRTSRIQVIPYERDSLIDRDIVTDFASRFDIDLKGFDRADVDINASISDQLFQLLRTTNRSYWADRSLPAEFLWFLRHSLPEGQEKSSLLTPEQRIQFLDQFGDSNRQIAERFIPNSAGVLFREPLPKPDQPYHGPSPLETETIQALLDAAYQQLVDNPPDAENMILAMLALWKASNHLLSVDVAHTEKTEQEIKELEALRASYDSASRQIRSLTEANESLRSEAAAQLRELTEANEELHSQTFQQAEELAALREQNDDLAARYDETFRRFEELSQTNKRLQAEFENQLRELTDANDNLRAEAASRIRELVDSQKELSVLHEQFEDLDRKYTQAQAYTKGLETNVREILWMAETTRKERDSLQEKNYHLSTQYDEASQQVRELSEANQSLSTETAAQLEELSALRGQLEELNQKYDQMQSYTQGLEENLHDILWMTEAIRKQESQGKRKPSSQPAPTNKVARKMLSIFPAFIKKRALLQLNMRRIRQSGLFDRVWYLQTYLDVAAQRMNPVRHYLLHGVEEGRDPNPHFSTRAYQRRYPDVAQSGMNPFVHYIRFGRYEGRIAHE